MSLRIEGITDVKVVPAEGMYFIPPNRRPNADSTTVTILGPLSADGVLRDFALVYQEKWIYWPHEGTEICDRFLFRAYVARGADDAVEMLARKRASISDQVVTNHW